MERLTPGLIEGWRYSWLSGIIELIAVEVDQNTQIEGVAGVVE